MTGGILVHCPSIKDFVQDLAKDMHYKQNTVLAKDLQSRQKTET